jgi:hypothetical protein
MSTELPKYLTFNNKQFEVEKLGDGVKKLLVIYQKWEQETIDSRLVVAKNEAALRDLTREIQIAVSKELVQTESVNEAEFNAEEVFPEIAEPNQDTE